MDKWTPKKQGVLIHGCHFYWYHLFQNYFLELLDTVENLAKKDPTAFHHHPLYKLLTSIIDSIEQRIAVDPLQPEFRLGHTLGVQNGHWRRVKNGLPNRYRMFFQFNKIPETNVVIAWINDHNTLRKAGSTSDVYEVFKKMLKRGDVPNTMEELLKATKIA